MGKPACAVRADGGQIGGIANDRDELTHPRTLGAGYQFSQKYAPPSLPGGYGAQVQRVFGGKTISGARFEPVAIGKTDNITRVFQDQVGKALGSYVCTACPHVRFGGRLDFESACSVQHMVAVNAANGR